MAGDDSTSIPVSPKEAKEKGLDHYFTGKPCRRGHVSVRNAKGATCLACSREVRREWRRDNPDRTKEIAKIGYAKNKDHYNQICKNYYAKNRKARLERSSKWHAENKQKANAASKAWRSKNPDSVNLYNHRRKARIRGQGGRFTAADIANLKKLQNGKCALFAHCGQPLMVGKKRNYQVDHIMPLARGGTHDRTNLQLLCRKCNLAKHARDPIDHARSIGMLL